MKTVYAIDLEIFGGVSIGDVAEEAVSLVAMTGVLVHFKFNDIRINVESGMTVQDCIDQYWTTVEKIEKEMKKNETTLKNVV